MKNVISQFFSFDVQVSFTTSSVYIKYYNDVNILIIKYLP